MAFRIGFDWDRRKAAANVLKHRISFEDASTVFRDPIAATILDEGHGEAEERWVTVGQMADRRLALVVHTWVQTDDESAIVRIISARRPTRREARQYREAKSP